jgi:paraquat-inducible protein A
MAAREDSSAVEHLACPDCGLLQVLPPARKGFVTECGRCQRVLAGSATGRIDAPLALVGAALLLLIPAVVWPLMSVSIVGAVRKSWLPSSASAMWEDGFASLGALVGLFSMAIPAAYMGLLVWVLGSLHFGYDRRLGPAFRWAQHLRPWVMIEVFLVGCFVAYSRIRVISAVDVTLGGWCLIAATLVLLFALTQLDDRTVWAAIPWTGEGSRKEKGGGCKVCDLLVSRRLSHCPRCEARLHVRKPDSFRRTLALVIAGYLLYIPANTLPVLTIIRFGREDPNTILSGVMELIHNHLWPLAIIVFSASIVLPLLKLCSLTWMLIATRRRSRHMLVGRTKLYRMIDLVGRWSNIDVFMVSVLVAILQFGVLTSVHAGKGLIAFGAVVIITMFATMFFDCRLMWDAPARRAHG